MTIDEIKALLKLEQHPVEGGYFRRTYTSTQSIKVDRQGLPVTRAMGTAIYYLLEPGTFSEMHVLSSDELFHFYLGDPVEMLQLWPDGRSEVVVLGPDLAAGQHVQLLVPQESGRARGWLAKVKLRCSDAPSCPASILLITRAAITPSYRRSGHRKTSASVI